MGFIERLKEVFQGTTEIRAGTDSVIINVPKEYYIKQMAVYCATSLIANALSQCEVKTYENNKSVKNEDYYSLNIRPNKNESASQFWHKVAEKMLRASPEKGALCFISGRDLYCADEYTIEQKRPFIGNLYSGIVVDEFQMNRKFNSEQVFLFKLENNQANKVISDLYSGYSNLIASAIEAYKDSNATQYIFKIDGLQAGDERFQKEWEDILKEQIQKYISHEAKVFVQYQGRELIKSKNENGAKSSDDVVKLIELLFSMVGKAYHIPESLMLGNINNLSDVVKAFLTFAVDPITDMIGKELTGKRGMDEYLAGNYYKVDSSKINHIDIFDMADSIDKLLSSSFMNVDELRDKTDLDLIGEEWSSKYMLTKNYEFIEQRLKEQGSDSNAQRKNDDELSTEADV